MKRLNLNFLVISFVFLAVVVRIMAAYFFSDTRLDNEWGTLVHNLELSGILGLNVVIDDLNAIHKFASPKDVVLPSIFMPPLYAYFIYFIKLLFGNLFDVIKTVILVQIILSLISIYLFFKISRKFEDFNYSFLLTTVFSFFPIYIYSCSQVSSIILQIFLFLFYFYFLIELLNKKKLIYLIYFSIFSGLLILIRGEFILFYFITIIYFFIYYKKKFKIFFFININFPDRNFTLPKKKSYVF